MGLIKEPKGIDFIVDGRSVTLQELEKIDLAINKLKSKNRRSIARVRTKLYVSQ